MTGIPTQSAFKDLTGLLKSLYTGANKTQRIDSVQLNDKGYVVLIGSTGGERPGLLHSNTGMKPEDMLASLG